MKELIKFVLLVFVIIILYSLLKWLERLDKSGGKKW